MSRSEPLPLALLDANLQLHGRLLHLWQQGAENWLDVGLGLAGESLAESDAELREALQDRDGPALAALPVAAFWRQVELRLADSQWLAQVGTTEQLAIARGLFDALRCWQAQATRAWVAWGHSLAVELWCGPPDATPRRRGGRDD